MIQSTVVGMSCLRRVDKNNGDGVTWSQIEV